MAFFRNLSSADMGRQTMRNYPGLIDSVMTYAQNCVASNRPDDKVPLLLHGSLQVFIPIVNNCSFGSSSQTLPSKPERGQDSFVAALPLSNMQYNF